MDCIIQWNLQSYRSNFSHLKLLIADHTPACICLQETLTGVNLRPPSSYVAYTSRPTRQDAHERGTAILVHQRIFHQHVPLNTCLQATAVKLNLGSIYTVCSLYLPHTDVTRAEIAALLDQLPRPYLLLGDMNARSHLWDPTYTQLPNAKGALFEELLTDYDVSLLNNSSFTHYHIQTDTHSVIDLSLCTSESLTDFRYSVNPSLCGSDHYPIHLTLARATSAHLLKPERFNTKKANWPLFRVLTSTDLDPDSFTTIDGFVDTLIGLILTAASASIPLCRSQQRDNPLPWWSEDLDAAKSACLCAERKLKRRYSIVNKIAYNRTKAKLKYLCRQAQRSYWIGFISSLTQQTNINQVWKRAQKVAGKFTASPIPVLLKDGRYLTDIKEVADELCCHFSRISRMSHSTREFRRFRLHAESVPLNFHTDSAFSYNDPFSARELDLALRSCNDSSPGLDKIPYSMLQHAHPSFRLLLLAAYNRIYAEGTYPTTWRLSIVIPFLKPGKDPYSPSNYRPIALTSCMGKLMERMVNARLVRYLEHHNCINIAQSGFRSNRSTTDNLVKLDTAIHRSLLDRKHLIAIFFDIQKAYDTAWRHGILKNLHEFGLRGHLPQFVAGFLSDRRIRVRLAATLSSEYPLDQGIPQGSVLSCTCFMVAINTINNSLPHSVGSTLYVDDFAIYASGSDSRMVQRQLQLAINKLQDWSNETGFRFSSDKTVSLHVCRKKHCPKLAPDLTLYDHPIPQRVTVRYLGLIFDSGYTWKPHILQLRSSCNKVLDLLKHISHKRWGADRRSLLRLYLMLLKPKIDYGLEAYSAAAPTYMTMIKRVQHHAIRIATGAFRSSPIPSLHAESGVKPFEYCLEAKFINFGLRLLVNRAHPLRHDFVNPTLPPRSFLSKTRRLFEDYDLDNVRLIPESFESADPWRLPPFSACSAMNSYTRARTSPIELKQLFTSHLVSHHTALTLYTDGSRTDAGVGYAVVTPDGIFSRKIHSIASSYSAELLAISKALQLSLQFPDASVVIVTDSRSSIQALDQLYSKHPLIQRIHSQLRHSSKRYTFCWCPSHVGVVPNERADAAARDAVINGVLSRTPIPRSDVKSFVKLFSVRRWEQHWRSQPLTNKLRAYKPTVSPYSNSYSPDRYWERTLCRLRIGHTHLTHQYLMDRSHRPYCDDCLVPLTVYHLLKECPSFSNERRIFGADSPYRDILSIHADKNGPLHRFLSAINHIHRF